MYTSVGVLTSHCYCPETRDGECVMSVGMGLSISWSPCHQHWLCVTEWHTGLAVTESDKTWPWHKLLQAVTGMLCISPSHQTRVTNCSEMHEWGDNWDEDLKWCITSWSSGLYCWGRSLLAGHKWCLMSACNRLILTEVFGQFGH